MEKPWNKNGDPKTEKGPHGDRVPQMGTHVASVHSHRRSFVTDEDGEELGILVVGCCSGALGVGESEIDR